MLDGTRHAMDAAGSDARRSGSAGARGHRGGADDAGGARPRPRGPHDGLGARSTDVDGLPRPRRLPGAREGERPGQARQGRQVQGTVLDLAVNSNSERGLLGIALHPKFKKNGWVYLFWSQSKTGADSTAGDGVRLMGNRIDRFEWEHGRLEFDKNIIKFRAFQQDAGRARCRGNHDGGVIRFGPDGKLYAIVGDTGRRGQMQNLATGPFTPPAGDDQFGGPGARRPAPHRRDRPPRRGRRRPARQPVLARRPHDGRRGRRERPEDLLVRHPQQLRHGLRPEVGRAVAAGERRRLVQRAQPRRAGHELAAGSRSWARLRASPSSRRSRRRWGRSADPRAPAATSASSRRAGCRPTSPTRRSRRCRACSCCRARSSATRS